MQQLGSKGIRGGGGDTSRASLATAASSARIAAAAGGRGITGGAVEKRALEAAAQQPDARRQRLLPHRRAGLQPGVDSPLNPSLAPPMKHSTSVGSLPRVVAATTFQGPRRGSAATREKATTLPSRDWPTLRGKPPRGSSGFFASSAATIRVPPEAAAAPPPRGLQQPPQPLKHASLSGRAPQTRQPDAGSSSGNVRRGSSSPRGNASAGYYYYCGGAGYSSGALPVLQVRGSDGLFVFPRSKRAPRRAGSSDAAGRPPLLQAASSTSSSPRKTSSRRGQGMLQPAASQRNASQLSLGAAEAAGSIDAERIWATILAMATAESIDVTWLVDPEREVTIVDSARMWLEEQASRDARLRRALPMLVGHGRRQALQWNQALRDRVAELREVEASNTLSYGTMQLTAAAGAVLKSLRDDHTTLSTFTSEVADELSRWQHFMVVVSLVLSSLLVTIWHDALPAAALILSFPQQGILPTACLCAEIARTHSQDYCACNKACM